MKFFAKLLMLIGLLIIVINGISGHSFNTEQYINDLSENLEPIPRLTIEFIELDEVDGDTEMQIKIIVRNIFKIIANIAIAILYLPKLLFWFFKMLGVVFKGIIWWQ